MTKVDLLLLGTIILSTCISCTPAATKASSSSIERHINLGDNWHVEFSRGFTYQLKIINDSNQPYEASADSHAAFVTDSTDLTLEITTFPKRKIGSGYPNFPDEYMKEPLVSNCYVEDSPGKSEYFGKAFYGTPQDEALMLKAKSPLPETCKLKKL